MRITLIFLLASISLFGQSTKISDMPSATSLTGVELVPIVQTTNKKSTVTLLRGWSTLGTAGQYLRVNAGATGLEFLTPAFVSGSTGSTDNAILRADGTGGSTVQSSAVTIDDTGNVTLGILGSTSGASRIIQPEGSASDIGLIFTPKGIGNFSSTANRVVFLASSDVSLTGDYTSISNNTSSLSGELRIYEPSTSGTNYNAFKTAAQSVDVTYTLPTAAPASNGYVMSGTTAGVLSWVAPGTGDVVGPGSATDNAIARFDATTGKLIQNSSLILDDSGNLNKTGQLDINTSEFVVNVSTGGSANINVDTDQLLIEGGGAGDLVWSKTAANTNNSLSSANGIATDVDANDLILSSGNGYTVSGDGDGGDVIIVGGVKRSAGAGSDGVIQIYQGSSSIGDGIQLLTSGGISSKVGIGNTSTSSSSFAAFAVSRNYAATNTVTNVMTLSARSTGTAAAGIGTGIEFYDENASGSIQKTVELQTVLTDATAGSEDADFVIKTSAASADPTEKARVTSDGRIYGTALHNNAGAVTGTDNQYIASGTFTPTLTGAENVAASTAYQCQWTRLGNVVTFSGKVDIDPTSTGALTRLRVSLPIASNFANDFECAGTGSKWDVANGSFAIRADATNNEAEITYFAGHSANATYSFTTTYLIL